jgi:NADH:ubiquinone oxidoreductase subunit 4 (subunit M)
MLLFYIFFELRILPIFAIIFYKGKQYERLRARIYLIVYTLFASFPFLFFILGMWDRGEVWLSEELIIKGRMSLFLILSYLAFLTKLPVFFQDLLV